HNVTQHKAAHGEFPCTTCNIAFLTHASLEDHYLGKASTIHPKCSRCGKGFFNATEVIEARPSAELLPHDLSLQHFKTVHPKILCPKPCGQETFKEDLENHYRESTHHPTCLICLANLKDDTAYNEHSATEHPESHCTTCQRQFTSKNELINHFVASAAHPKCHQCTLGFTDDDALEKV
ncbi:hypothetical protein DFH06DRAFT_933012, partial [Mycena polygramma]